MGTKERVSQMALRRRSAADLERIHVQEVTKVVEDTQRSFNTFIRMNAEFLKQAGVVQIFEEIRDQGVVVGSNKPGTLDKEDNGIIGDMFQLITGRTRIIKKRVPFTPAGVSLDHSQAYLSFDRGTIRATGDYKTGEIAVKGKETFLVHNGDELMEAIFRAIENPCPPTSPTIEYPIQYSQETLNNFADMARWQIERSSPTPTGFTDPDGSRHTFTYD